MTKTNESIKQELMPINCQKSSNDQILLAADSSRDPLELSSEEVEAITDRNVYEERGVITGKLTQLKIDYVPKLCKSRFGKKSLVITCRYVCLKPCPAKGMALDVAIERLSLFVIFKTIVFHLPPLYVHIRAVPSLLPDSNLSCEVLHH